jgi:hypothetical protein
MKCLLATADRQYRSKLPYPTSVNHVTCKLQVETCRKRTMIVKKHAVIIEWVALCELLVLWQWYGSCNSAFMDLHSGLFMTKYSHAARPVVVFKNVVGGFFAQ